MGCRRGKAEKQKRAAMQKGESAKEYNTWDSNVVPHRSTNQARTCLTSLSGREAVLSCWYGRIRQPSQFHAIINLLQTYSYTNTTNISIPKIPTTNTHPPCNPSTPTLHYTHLNSFSSPLPDKQTSFGNYTHNFTPAVFFSLSYWYA